MFANGDDYRYYGRKQIYHYYQNDQNATKYLTW